jgi:dTDP-4-amino-4,6-dideoxygalactose transaminase
MGIGNYVLSPLSATLLSLQLRDINIILENRNRIQQLYRNNLNIVYHENNNDSVHAVAYITDKADLIYNTFKLKNIETRYKMYPSQNNMSNSDYIFERYIELPQSYDLTKEDIDNICSDIIKLESKKSTDKLSSLMSRFNK